jgi:hypothetical protein
MLLIGSAAMSNVRRICRYLQDKNKPESQKKSPEKHLDTPIFHFLSRCSCFFSTFLAFSAHRATDQVFSN